MSPRPRTEEALSGRRGHKRSLIWLWGLTALVVVGSFFLPTGLWQNSPKGETQNWDSLVTAHSILDTAELAEFDPNDLDSVGWVSVGMHPDWAKRLAAYQRAGGHFERPEDLLRLDGFPLGDYYRLKSKLTFAGKALLRFDLNTVSMGQLQEIDGIGLKRSQWIVDYREKLGGFLSTDQMYEVFGLDSALVREVLRHADLGSITPKQLSLNDDPFEVLVRHPYLTHRQAGTIVLHRENNGPFTSLDDLLKHDLVPAEKVDKLRPYLRL